MNINGKHNSSSETDTPELDGMGAIMLARDMQPNIIIEKLISQGATAEMVQSVVKHGEKMLNTESQKNAKTSILVGLCSAAVALFLLLIGHTHGHTNPSNRLYTIFGIFMIVGIYRFAKGLLRISL